METKPLELLERAYDLDLSTQEWQVAMVDGLSALFPRAEGRFGFVYTFDEEGVELPHAHDSPDDVPAELVGGVIANVSSKHQRTAMRLFDTVQCSTLSKRLRELGDTQVAASFREAGVIDCAAICAGNATGAGFFFGAFLPESTNLGVAFQRRWMAVASHLAAVRRLHATLEGIDPLNHAEMVFDPALASVVNAKGPAKRTTSRERLRLAAINLDELRRANADEDKRLSRWSALINGRWSLVDVFDSDGRRFVVAIANAPEAQPIAALSKRQAQIVSLLLQGHTQTFIGYELGLTQSTVAYHLARVRRVFRAANDVDLLNRLATMLDGGVGTHRLGDSEIQVAVAESGLDANELPDALTHTLALLRQGSSAQEIATSRGVSVKTVRNQVAEIYRRFGVNSRVELLALLAAQ
ncbi:MAG: helix-turn-helix transcriptional regulator [bacterium]